MAKTRRFTSKKNCITSNFWNCLFVCIFCFVLCGQKKQSTTAQTLSDVNRLMNVWLPDFVVNYKQSRQQQKNIK